MICFGTHNDHLMSFHVNASLKSFQSLMNKSPRLWAQQQLLPLLKLKVAVACNGFRDWRSGVCLFSFVPNLLFSVLSDSFISPAACSKHSQADPSLLLLAGTVAPPEMILPGGLFAQTKQPNKLMLTFTASDGSFKKIHWQHNFSSRLQWSSITQMIIHRTL